MKTPKTVSEDVPVPEKLSDLHDLLIYYGHHAEEYDADYVDCYWQLYDDLTWRFLLPFLPSSKTELILDVGGGTGKWAIKLAKMGYHVVCADISEPMLAVARQKIHALHLEDNIACCILDVRDMSAIPSNQYGLILALGDVISYALDDDRAVAELFRVCQPGGICVASVDSKFVYLLNHIKYNHFSVIEEVNQTGISSFFKAHRVKTYLPAELEVLFVKHGFKVQEIVGKPIFSGALRRKMREAKLTAQYDQILALELEYGKNPSFLGQAGHLQITGQKPAS